MLPAGPPARVLDSPPELRDLRELVRYRQKLTGWRTSAKAQYHAMMSKCGVLSTQSDMSSPSGRHLFSCPPDPLRKGVRPQGHPRPYHQAGIRPARRAAVEAVGRYHGGGAIRPAWSRVTKRRGESIGRVAAARTLTFVYYGRRDGHIRCLADKRRESRLGHSQDASSTIDVAPPMEGPRS